MKSNFKMSFTLLAFLFLLNSSGINANEKVVKSEDPEKDKVLIFVLKNILTRGHYVVKDLNDSFSEHVFNTFIEGLDPSKRYFTQEDIK